MKFNISKIFVSQMALVAINIPISVFATKVIDQDDSKSIAIKRMNVLFIAVDDLKPVLGCYGDKLIKTPNIDRLAQNATVFLSNYCQQAISGPTRASLMTGKRPDYTKVWNLKTKMRDVNPEIVTIPQYFASQGYQSVGIGKVYDPRCVDENNDKPSWSVPYYEVDKSYYYNNRMPAMSFYQNPETHSKIKLYTQEAINMGKDENEITRYVSEKIKPSVESMDLPDNAYTDGAMIIKAREIMEQLARKPQPFFYAVGFARPHLPFTAPKSYWDLYNRDEIPLAKFQKHAVNSPNFAYHKSEELKSFSDIPALVEFTDVKLNGIQLPIYKQKELIHGYYAAVSYVDAQIGKLLNTLDSLGLTKNTIVVLWGDHGWHLGDHDLWCKHTNFENATRSPLIISAPGIQDGKTTSLTEFVDVFPTLCELAGLKIPEALDGKSLVGLMKHTEKSVKDYSISQYPRGDKLMGYSIRTKKYRLTYWMNSGFRSINPFKKEFITAKELYDYENDPLETINVVKNEKYVSVLTDMELKMLEFFKTQEK